MLDTAQLRRSENYGDLWVLQEETIELQALRELRGVLTPRDLSPDQIVVHLRYYDVDPHGATTLLHDYTMTKVVDPILGGLPGVTGIVRAEVRIDVASPEAIAYWVAEDTGVVQAGTPSGHRELRLCKPWRVVVHEVPAVA
jgi:hypothetical protein